MIGHAATAAIFPWHIANSYLTVVAKILSLKSKNIYSYFGFYLKNVVFDETLSLSKLFVLNFSIFVSFLTIIPSLNSISLFFICMSLYLSVFLSVTVLLERITIVISCSC